MHHSYEDIYVATDRHATWHDENGTPRFLEHHPKHAPNIYDDEVALVRISCQGCDREFDVQMSCGLGEKVERHIATKLTDIGDAIIALTTPPDREVATPIDPVDLKFDELVADWNRFRRAHKPSPHQLADSIRYGTVHYGDPPNVGCCPAGPSMNCWDLRVLEYWARGTAREVLEGHTPQPTMRMECLDWKRFPELEIALPDETDPDRLERV